MRRSKILLFVLTIMLASISIDGNAQRLLGLFELEQGVRNAAMGGAYVALAEGDLGVYYNPAGLATVRELHLNSFYESRFTRVDQGVFSLAVPNFATQLLFLSVNGAVRRDANGNGGDAIPYSQFGMSFGSGFTMEQLSGSLEYKGLAAGGQFKIYSVSNDAAGSGLSVSITPSILWTGERLDFGGFPVQFVRFGVIAPDLLGLGITYGSGHRESWGPGLRLGGSVTTSGGLTIALDLDALGSFHLGGEWQNRGMDFGGLMADLSIRAGLKNIGSMIAPSIGFGLRLGDLRVDYAFVVHSELPGIHRISISGVFGPPNFLLCALRPTFCPPDDP